MNHPVTYKNKKYIVGIFSTILILGFVLFGCTTTAVTPTEEAPLPEPTIEAEEEIELVQVKIGVSPVPHGDIVRFIQENLAAEAGLDLEIVEFTDYVQPNLALDDGTIDANFFQHIPYLEDFNEGNNLNLVSVAAIHIEPLGIYSNTLSSLDEIPDGAVVGIPNDATNASRALNLLAANGLITIREGAGFSATVNDIVENPKNLRITELEAAQLVRSLDDTSISVINGNYALEGGLTPSTDALALESGEDNPYANVLVVNAGNENYEGVLILKELLTSQEVKDFINEKYSGSVLPAF